MTYPVQLNGVDPLLPVLWVLCSEVPHAVVHTYVHTALVKLVRLRQTNPENDKKWFAMRIKMRNWVNIFVQMICIFYFKRKGNNVSPAQRNKMMGV